MSAVVSDPPEWACCPISGQLTRDPVIVDAICLHTCSRSAFEGWTSQGHSTCPMCGTKLRSTQVAPNVPLKGATEAYLVAKTQQQAALGDADKSKGSILWKQVVTFGKRPSPRESHSMVKAGNHAIVYGGFNGEKRLNDLYMLDLTNNEWQEVARQPAPAVWPPSMAWHLSTVACVNGRQKMYLLGADYDTSYSHNPEVDGTQLWSFDVLDKTWMRVAFDMLNDKVSERPPKYYHSGAMIESEGNLIVLGGSQLLPNVPGLAQVLSLETVFVFNLENMIWSKVQTKGVPALNTPQRHMFSVSRSADKRYLHVFGGADHDHVRCNDMNVLDLREWTWHQCGDVVTRKRRRFPPFFKKIASSCDLQPHPRSSHVGVTMGKTAIIFHGGYYGQEVGYDERLDDTWSFNMETCKWTQLEQAAGSSPPPPCGNLGGIVDGKRLLIFGGECAKYARHLDSLFEGTISLPKE